MLLLLALVVQAPTPRSPRSPRPSDLLKRAHTYSIVAYDSVTGDAVPWVAKGR